MLAAELDGGFLQARIAVGEGVGRIVERGFVAHFAVGAGKGEEQLVGRLGYGGAAGQTGVEGPGGRRVVGVNPQFVGCVQGEDQLRRSLGLGEEVLAEVRMQAVYAHVHAGLGGAGAGGPVVVPQGRAGFHGQGGALGYALRTRVSGGQNGCGLVKILIDALQDNFPVDPSLLVSFFQGNVLGVVRYVAEEEGEDGIGTGTEEFGFSDVLGNELVGHGAPCAFDFLDNLVGTGDHLVAVGPGRRADAGGSVNGAGHPIVQLGTLVPVVGETVGVIQARALHVPQGGTIQVVQGQGDLLLAGVPVLAGTLGERIQVKIYATGQEHCRGEKG